jgi:AraC family transcriptional regulator, regulatory protein of adaptative response / DNA-3-methyladenine glycosylase II
MGRMVAPIATPPWPAEAAYQALCDHDARFDGRLFVGVTSTGIYCRPVCRVRLPRRENCRFFHQAAQAEAAGFRPCLRCRPELAPGLSLADSSEVLAAQAARWMRQAVHAGEPVALPAIAHRLGVTDRHLRRIFLRAHGVAPVAWLGTQRLLLAKQLLTDTALPVTEVALASGFGSLRRFHAAFAAHYRLSPGQLRAAREPTDGPAGPAAGAPRRAVRRAGPMAQAADGTAALWLAYRPPYDLAGVGRFLGRRALPGVERVAAGPGRLQACRTLALDHQGQRLAGWLAVDWVAERHALRLTLSPQLVPAAGALLQRCRHALDLDAEPARIAEALAALPGGPRPGVRIPGGWCGLESAVRVILGQQVTVAAAGTLAARLVQALGEPIATPHTGLDRLFPSAEAIANASPDTLGRLGIVRQRVRALQALATEVAAGRLALDPGAPLQPTLETLRALPGIGDWTAQLIAMRALAWSDAWLPTDIGVLKALGTRDPAEATARVAACQPWRAYAVMQLWLSLEQATAAVTLSTTDPTTEHT